MITTEVANAEEYLLSQSGSGWKLIGSCVYFAFDNEISNAIKVKPIY